METAAAFLGISALVIVTPGQDTVGTIHNAPANAPRRRASLSLKLARSPRVAAPSADVAGSTSLQRRPPPRIQSIARRSSSSKAQALIAAVKGSAVDRVDAAQRTRLAPTAALQQGLVSNLGNPKMAVFFTSLLPQFVPSGPAAFGAMLGLSLVFCCMTLCWLSVYAFAVGRAGDVLGRPKIRRAIDGVVGIVLIAFGIRLATQQR